MPEHDHGEPASGSPFDGGSPLGALGALFGEGSPFVPGNGPECAVCPFCLLLYGVRQARPEVMEHLVKASMELVLAMKAVVDAAAQRQDGGGALRRIPIS